MLPHPARGTSRHRFDERMLARADALGAAVERGVTVRAIAGESVRLADSATIESATILLATGKHDVRGVARPAAARGADPTLGLRVRLSPSPTLDRLVGDAIELHMFDRGYAGLVRQEDGSANLCMAVHRSRLDAAGSPAALLAQLGQECPALAERLAHLESGASIDAIANVPYGWRARETAPGLFRLGDQAGVIPSLAGEGMGIAIASGIAAAGNVSREEPAQHYQHAFARQLASPLLLAGMVRTLAEGPKAARWLVTAAAAAPSLAGLLARLTRIAPPSVDVGPPSSHI